MAEPVRLRFNAEVFQALGKMREVVGGLHQVEEQSGQTSSLIARHQASIREQVRLTAREQVVSAVKEREALQSVHAEYSRIAENAKRGSAIQVEANKLAADSARRLGLAYQEAGAAAAGTGRRSAAAAEESGIKRGFVSRASGIGGAFAGPGFIAGAVLGIGAVTAVKETLAEQEAQGQLRNALRNSGLAWRANRDEIEKTIKSQEHLSGFGKTELTQTYTQLMRVTGSVSEANRLLADTTNVARGRHIGLEQAAMLLTKAHMGNVGALRRLGIDVSKTTVNMDALRAAHIKVTDANRAQVAEMVKHAKALDLQATKTLVLDTVEARYHDAALTRSKTLQGRIDALRNIFRDLMITVGTHLIPVLTRALEWFQKIIVQLQHSATAHELLHKAVNLLRLAWIGVSTIVKDVVIPILSTVGGFLQRHKRMAEILAVTLGLLFAPLIIAVPIAVGYIVTHWSKISKFFSNLVDTITGFFHKLWDDLKLSALQAVADIVEPFSHLPGSLGKWARNAKDSIHNEMAKVKADMAQIGSDAGTTFGQAFANSASQGVGAAVEAAAKGVAGQARSGTTAAVVSPGGKGPAAYAVAAAQLPGADTVGFSIAGEASPHDCSAFVQAVFKNSGAGDIGRDTYAQYAHGTHISRAQLQPNDVIFMNFPGERSPGHVGIYVGGGYMVHDSGAHGGVKQIPVPWGNVVGYRRYIKADIPADAGGDGGDTSTTSAPRTSTPTANAALAAQEQAAAAQAKAAAAAAKLAHHHVAKASEASVAGVQQTIDDTLAKLHEHGLDTVAKNTEAGLRKLRAQLKTGMTSADLAMLRVSLRPLQHEAADAISKGTKEARAKLAEQRKELAAHNREIAREVAKANRDVAAINARALADAQREWQRAWGDFTRRVDRQFDLETRNHVRDMQRSMASDLRDMQEAWTAQMRAFDNATQVGLGQFSVAQTPEEKALADWKSKQDAQAHTDTMAGLQQAIVAAQAAQAAGVGDTSAMTPDEILAAQKQLNDAVVTAQKAMQDQLVSDQGQALQDAADASRAAQDQQTKVAQDAYQQQRDDQKQALEDQHSDLVDAWTQTRQDAIDNYSQLRDDAKTAMDEALSEIEAGMQAHTSAWADVGNLLGGSLVSGILSQLAAAGVDPSVLTGGYARTGADLGLKSSDPSVAIKALAPRLRAGRKFDVPGMAAGGVVPGVDYGKDSVLRMLRPGEYVETVEERRSGVHGGNGGGSTVVLHNPQFYGTNERQVMRELARLIAPEQGRILRIDSGGGGR